MHSSNIHFKTIFFVLKGVGGLKVGVGGRGGHSVKVSGPSRLRFGAKDGKGRVGPGGARGRDGKMY